MKTLMFLKSFLLVGSASLFFLTACSKGDLDPNTDNQTVYSTRGDASGSQQSPAVSTSATGTLNGVFDANTNKWDYEISWTGLSSAASAVEIHGPASVGINGQLQVALVISVPGVNGSATGSVTLTEEQQAALLANQLYYTVVSSTHVMGEIRGQITASLVRQ